MPENDWSRERTNHIVDEVGASVEEAGPRYLVDWSYLL